MGTQVDRTFDDQGFLVGTFQKHLQLVKVGGDLAFTGAIGSTGLAAKSFQLGASRRVT